MNDAEKLEAIRRAWADIDIDYDCGCSQPCACAYADVLKVLGQLFGDEG